MKQQGLLDRMYEYIGILYNQNCVEYFETATTLLHNLKWRFFFLDIAAWG